MTNNSTDDKTRLISLAGEMSKWANEQMTDEPTPAPGEGASNPTEDKTRFITLAEAAEMYGFSRNYLGNLVRRGRLKARKSGRVWLTTPADVEKFVASRERRGKYRNDIQTFGLDKR